MYRGGVETPSLEHLIEQEDLGVEVLHPGGLVLTAEVARLCGIHSGARVLEVASGTGESACLLTNEFGARVTGVDRSPQMLARALRKARLRGLSIGWVHADAHALPFVESVFDAVLCECSLCHLDKSAAMREMVRVVRPGGAVGIHDLCWTPNTPGSLKHALKELEQEEPGTPDEWVGLFQRAGLVATYLYDRSDVIAGWIRQTRSQLGVKGYIRAALKAWGRWGFAGLRRILASQRLFTDSHMGYAVVVGRKPMGDGATPA